MEKLDFFVGGGVMYELDPTSKTDALETLVRKLSELRHLRPHLVAPIVRALVQRERLGSTAIGRGLAVPHAKHDSIKRFVGIIGHVPGGVDFDSLDGEPVEKIFLVLSPPDRPGEHLRILERISKFLRRAV